MWAEVNGNVAFRDTCVCTFSFVATKNQALVILVNSVLLTWHSTSFVLIERFISESFATVKSRFWKHENEAPWCSRLSLAAPPCFTLSSVIVLIKRALTSPVRLDQGEGSFDFECTFPCLFSLNCLDRTIQDPRLPYSFDSELQWKRTKLLSASKDPNYWSWVCKPAVETMKISVIEVREDAERISCNF